MNEKNCLRQKGYKPEHKRKTLQVTIRITQEVSKWLRDKKYSPTAVFNEALKELGYKIE